MQISELARRAHLTVHQVRRYEREGFIAGRRGENGHRRYDPEMAAVARRVGHLADLGFSVGEIRTFIDRLSHPANGAEPAEMEQRRRRLLKIDATIDSLRATRAELMELLVSDDYDA